MLWAIELSPEEKATFSLLFGSNNQVRIVSDVRQGHYVWSPVVWGASSCVDRLGRSKSDSLRCAPRRNGTALDNASAHDVPLATCSRISNT